MDRKQEREELFFQLGALVQPVFEIIAQPDKYSQSERVRARAKFVVDKRKFVQLVEKFANSEQGYAYTVEYYRVYYAARSIETSLDKHFDDVEILVQVLNDQIGIIRAAIRLIPVPDISQVLVARSPFSSYCALKDRCLVTQTRLTLVDQYLDANLFHRYFRDLSSTTVLTYITQPAEDYTRKGGKLAREWQEFLDISRQFATERGAEKYHLVTHPDTHDRWLACDDEIYVLGGSMKHAAMYSDFTVTKSDNAAANFARIEHYLETGTELFGTTQTQHP